jgi:hypothetical protein
MWKIENNYSVKIGGNIYINITNILKYKDENIFIIKRSTHDGLLGINFDIYNKNGIKIAVVKNGNIYKGDKNNYDIIVNENEYTLLNRHEKRTICNIKKTTKAKDVELEITVELFMKDGFLFHATPESTNLKGLIIQGNTFENRNFGINIGEKGTFLG